MTSIRAVAGIVLIGTGSVAADQIARDTFGPGNSFNGTSVVQFGGPFAPSDRMGFRFQAQASGGVSRLTLGLISRGGDPSPVDFELYADAGGLPGTRLGVWTAAIPVGPPVFQLDTDGSVPVLQGTTYYFVVHPTDHQREYWWFASPDPTPGLLVSQAPGEPWTSVSHPWLPNSAFRIEVVPSPDGPCILALFAGAAGRRRRRR